MIIAKHEMMGRNKINDTAVKKFILYISEMANINMKHVINENCNIYVLLLGFVFIYFLNFSNMKIKTSFF
jgi:hypothetical protein